jgi:hypothetical protein
MAVAKITYFKKFTMILNNFIYMSRWTYTKVSDVQLNFSSKLALKRQL